MTTRALAEHGERMKLLASMTRENLARGDAEAAPMIDGVPDGLSTIQDELQFFWLDNTSDVIGFPVTLRLREQQDLLDEHRDEVHARYARRTIRMTENHDPGDEDRR